MQYPVQYFEKFTYLHEVNKDDVNFEQHFPATQLFCREENIQGKSICLINDRKVLQLGTVINFIIKTYMLLFIAVMKMHLIDEGDGTSGTV